MRNLFIGLFLAATSMTANVMVGVPDANNGNCIPFGCGRYSPGEYQQIYDSGYFAAPIVITGLRFFNTQYNSNATSLPTGEWLFYLSTTAVNWDTITDSQSGNQGPDITYAFGGDLARSWAFGNTLEINFINPFTYNPANGNLILQVNHNKLTDLGGEVYFDVARSPVNMSRKIFYSNAGDKNIGFGLVTEFVTSEVPEPGSVALAATGLAGLWMARRRRRAA